MFFGDVRLFEKSGLPRGAALTGFKQGQMCVFGTRYPLFMPAKARVSCTRQVTPQLVCTGCVGKGPPGRCMHGLHAHGYLRLLVLGALPLWSTARCMVLATHCKL